MTAKKLIAYYAKMSHWYRGLSKLSACWRMEELVGMPYAEAEKARVNEANRLLESAKTIYSEVWEARIGKAVAAEIRRGEWKS